MPKFYFGADHPDKLILSWNDVSKPCMEYFYTGLIDGDSVLCKSLWTGEVRGSFGYKIYKKDDEDYNIEKSILDYKSRETKGGHYPFYILKNKKWFICSPKTDFILIPCDGEYSDLTGLKL